MRKQHFLTTLIHGWEKEKTYAREVNVPVYLTATFQQKSFEDHSGYGYARGNNPTREALEQLVARLEGGSFGFAFASGMAATQASFSLFQTGDRILISSNVYGGTYDVLEKIFKRFGLSYSVADTTDLEGLEKEISKGVKGIFIETPANPTLTVTDLKGIAELAKKYGVLTIADNTFMSPYLQQPLTFGIDVVVESATKYLGGHSDLIAGVLAVNDEKLAERIHEIQCFAGGILQPFDSFLLVRGIKTLGVRLDRQVANAEAIVGFLISHNAVKSIHYPGLESDPGYRTQLCQARNGGAMLSFELKEEYDTGKFLDSLQIIIQGASLGGVESLIGHPATTSHRSLPQSLKNKTGITDRLIRLSPGIEDADDLIEDLKQAFEAAKID